MKQPHEDIRGTDRSGDPLLSLAATDIATRDAIITLTYHLQRATFVGHPALQRATLDGHPAPIVQRMFDRMRAPQPGDLVVELSVLHRSDPETRMHGLGYLVEKRDEWATTDDVWERDVAESPWLVDEGRAADTAWYVQYGPDPADVCRWTNCDFLMVPTAADVFDATPARPVVPR